MAQNIQKRRQQSKIQVANPLNDRALADHARRAKTRLTGKVTIDQYMEALRKEVILSQ